MNEVVLDRADARRSFENAAAHRVSIVAAPEGFGKSYLVRALDRRRFTIFEVGADSSFERFVSAIARHALPLARGVSRSIARVYAKALEREDGPAELAAWFVRCLAGSPQVLVIDGADADRDPRIAAFLRAAIAASPADVRWLLVGRDPERLRALASASEFRVFLGEDALRLGFPELKRLADAIAPGHAGGELFAIARKADGCISRAVFLLRCLQFGIPAAADGDPSIVPLLDSCYAGLSARERLETMAAILLEDGGDVEGGALARDVSSVLSRLRTTAPFLFEPGGRALQACFRERLRAETRRLIAQNETDLFVRAADALEANGDTASAVALYCTVDAIDRLVAVVERRGGLGLEGEQVHVLREAIALMPDHVRERHPLVVGLRAVDAANRGRHAEAKRLFERALRGCAPGDRDQTIRYWYAGASMGAGDVATVKRLLQPTVEFFRTPPPLRAASMALLGTAWSIDGDAGRAKRWVERACVIGDACNDDALAARIYQQAAFVAHRGADRDAAHALGSRAVAHADASGWPHVAAISYVVLHQVALECDRREEAAAAARGIAENALRAGNVPLQYAGAAACYEYAMEACDPAATAAARAELAVLGSTGMPSANEFERGVLAANALEISWQGRFAEAYERVAPLVDGYASMLPETPHDSHIVLDAAVYAAAAGMPVQANRALRLGRSARERDPGNGTRSRIAEAFALWLLGDGCGARLAIRGVLAQLPASRTRPRVYAELIASVVESRDEPETIRITSLEEELHALGWGGLARLCRSVLATRRGGRRTLQRATRATG